MVNIVFRCPKVVWLRHLLAKLPSSLWICMSCFVITSEVSSYYQPWTSTLLQNISCIFSCRWTAFPCDVIIALGPDIYEVHCSFALYRLLMLDICSGDFAVLLDLEIVHLFWDYLSSKWCLIFIVVTWMQEPIPVTQLVRETAAVMQEFTQSGYAYQYCFMF